MGLISIIKGKDDNMKLVEDKKQELSKLYQRIDEDMNYYQLKDFVVKYNVGENKNKPIPGAESVNTLMPRVFADRVLSMISAAELTPHVDSELLSEDAHNEIEQWEHCVRYNADREFFKQSRLPVHTYDTFSSCIAGWVPRFNWCYTDSNGNTRFIIRPLDIKKLTWQESVDGLVWGCVESERDPITIEYEYGIKVKGKKGVVRDFWTPEINVVYIDGKKQIEQENTSDVVPLVIHPVGDTPFFDWGTEANISMLGASLYAGCRKNIDEINYALSILKTITVLGWRPPLGMVSKDGTRAPDEYPYKGGTFLKLMEGEHFEKIPFQEVMQQISFFYGALDAEMQRATLPYNEYGGLNFELSALALETLQKQRDQVFIPRLKAIEIANQESMVMLFNQWVDGAAKGSFKNSISRENGVVVSFDASKMSKYKGKFQLTYKIATTSPERDISSYTKGAAAAQLGVSQETILRDIIQFENPEKELDRRNNEVMDELMPERRLLRRLRSIYNELKNTDMDKDERYSLMLEADMIESQLARSQQASGDGGAAPASMPQDAGGGQPFHPRQNTTSWVPPTQTEQMRREGMEVRERAE